MMTKWDVILRGSYFCEKYVLIEQAEVCIIFESSEEDYEEIR